jgi:hypothetical protein
MQAAGGRTQGATAATAEWPWHLPRCSCIPGLDSKQLYVVATQLQYNVGQAGCVSIHRTELREQADPGPMMSRTPDLAMCSEK